MDIYTAIMKAADTIESSPKLYSFWENEVSHDCGTPHCLVGWIGFHLGMHGKRVFRDVLPALGFPIPGTTVGQALGASFMRHGNYQSDPKLATALLREFAQRYKPKHTGLPDIVREIFTQRAVA